MRCPFKILFYFKNDSTFATTYIIMMQSFAEKKKGDFFEILIEKKIKN